ncbi:MAG TPA: M20/M25/M40 family metallo-hydrolase [Thermoanaerobaculia bacterium]|nr:M20/M25/M40 family metallo-hydrolase [Thermoanaerobaculia bacterium]
MKKVALITMVLISATSLLAQDALRANAARLMTRELEASKAYETLEYLSDDIGQRLSGSKNAEAAILWSVERFRSWGIDVHTEKVIVPHWVRGEEYATLPSQMDQKIVVTALGGSVATPANGITAEVIELDSYEQLKAQGDKVRGKIVVWNNPMDLNLVRSGRGFEAYRFAVEFRGSGASKAAEYGALASLVRSVGSASLRTPHTGALKYEDNQPKIPAGAMTVEDSLLIHRLLAKGEKVIMHLVLTPQTLPPVESANVVAEIRGSTTPDEVVVLGGHLDSWDLGTGAIDDGGGVAQVMDAMRVIKESGLKPRRTIRCVLFMNEENGLAGGKQYAADHKDELAKHVAAIETDSGSAAPAGFRTTLDGAARKNFEQTVAGVFGRIGAARFETAKNTGADISPLTDAGVTGFSLEPDSLHYFDYHHTPADTLDKIDPKELAQDSAAIVALTYVLADMPPAR